MNYVCHECGLPLQDISDPRSPDWLRLYYCPRCVIYYREEKRTVLEKEWMIPTKFKVQEVTN